MVKNDRQVTVALMSSETERRIRNEPRLIKKTDGDRMKIRKWDRGCRKRLKRDI